MSAATTAADVSSSSSDGLRPHDLYNAFVASNGAGSTMSLYRVVFNTLVCTLCPLAQAAVVCPPMPAAVTTVSKDVKSDINATVGSLGKLKAGDLAIKTEVFSKNLFDKYPNLDRLLALQTMSATYCAMLNQSAIPDTEKLNRWEKFQEKVLDLQTKVSASPPPKRAPAAAASKAA
jgi:hypothetical protein